MKNNIGRRFYTQVLTNIVYSTLIACLVEVFLITNIDMLATYLVETESSLASLTVLFRMGTITTILYVILGICIFSLRIDFVPSSISICLSVRRAVSIIASL